VSDSENQRKLELERLRLASELTQLATDTPNPDLKSRFRRMAQIWSDQADQPPAGNATDDLKHSDAIDAPLNTPPSIVLIVEDDLFLRMLAVDEIEAAGFTTLEAVDADEAVVLLETRSDIALLFTDIDMPGSIDGLKLAHLVRKRWPPIKILVVSGRVQLPLCELPPNSRFLVKPYGSADMIAALRALARSTRFEHGLGDQWRNGR
jgi:CheY-like chemotaxis protein